MKAKGILRTKIHRPPVTAEHVYRDQLVACLQRNKYKPFTLISAQAGYGKSMLVSSWLEKCSCSHAWISLSEDDNDLHTFLTYIQFAVTNTFPESLEEFSALLKGPQIPPLKIISEILLNDLDKISEEYILVLDDFQLIHNQKINELLDLLIKYPPQCMHLVILTRRDPLLNLSLLRAHSRMNEIRMSELCFSRDEIKQLYQNLLDVDLNDKSIEVLGNRTEGWVTGLRLTSLAMKEPKEIARILEEQKANFHFSADFLIQEVLTKQSRERQKLLVISSLLNRFEAGLVDHLLAIDQSGKGSAYSGKEFIDWALQSNLFIIALDDRNRWFRYHHLFQDLLQTRLDHYYDEEQVKMLHKHASEWFEQNAYYEESIYHAVKSGDTQLPVRIVGTHHMELLNSEQMIRLNKWLSYFPDHSIQSNPMLLFIRAYYYDYRGRTGDTFELLNQLDALLTKGFDYGDQQDYIQGAYLSFLAQKHYFMGDAEKSLKNAKKALKLLPHEAQYTKTVTLYWIVFSLHMLGKGLEAEKLLIKATEDSSVFDYSSHSRLYINQCAYYYMQGELKKLEKAAGKALVLGEKHGLIESIGLSHYFSGSQCYLQNKLDEAAFHFNAVFSNRYSNRLHYSMIGGCLSALIFWTKGHFNQALALAKDIDDFAKDLESPMIDEYNRALKLELALKQGGPGKVQALSVGTDFGVYPPFWFSFLPQLTSLKMLLASGSDQSAGKLLRGFIDYARTNHNVTFEIQVLAIKALHLWNTGNESTALEALSESIGLSESGGFIRIYLDHGGEMEEMIRSLPANHKNRDYLTQIIGAFEYEKANTANILKTQKASVTGVLRHPALDETLTRRETEVIDLLAKGLRNKEIAEKLFISNDTVKKHLRNIFVKLNVDNRIQAARKVAEMGLVEMD